MAENNEQIEGAKVAVNEFLDARETFQEAQDAFNEAEKRYKAVCAEAAKACEGITFKSKDGSLYFFSKVRGGGYALKARQERWDSEGLTIVSVGDRL